MKLHVTIYNKKSKILQIYCVFIVFFCNKYFRRYTVIIRCKVILNSLVKGLSGKGLFGRPSISRRERIFFLSSLADWLLGIPNSNPMNKKAFLCPEAKRSRFESHIHPYQFSKTIFHVHSFLFIFTSSCLTL